MPKQIQTPNPGARLTAALGLMGKTSLSMDEVVVPTAETLSLERSPFQLSTPCGIARWEPAIVGRYSFVAARPYASTILSIDNIQIANRTAGALEVQVRLLSAAHIAAANITVTNGLLNFNANRIDAATPARVPSDCVEGDVAALPGTQLSVFDLVADGIRDVTFPHGLFLHGDDPLGPAGIGVFVNSANTDCPHCQFSCREWPKL